MKSNLTVSYVIRLKYDRIYSQNFMNNQINNDYLKSHIISFCLSGEDSEINLRLVLPRQIIRHCSRLSTLHAHNKSTPFHGGSPLLWRACKTCGGILIRQGTMPTFRAIISRVCHPPRSSGFQLVAVCALPLLIVVDSSTKTSLQQSETIVTEDGLRVTWCECRDVKKCLPRTNIAIFKPIKLYGLTSLWYV